MRTAGDDTNAGTKTRPVRTIDAAIARAKNQGKPVYVCAQEFKESVEIPEGVTIFGGLDCKAGWTYVGPATKTKILPDADRIPLRFVKGVSGAIHIEDIEVTAADATIPSGSSIAAIADAVTLNLVRVDLFAGAGKFGNDGTMPTDDLGPMDPSDMKIVGYNGAVGCNGGPTGGPGGEEKKNPLCMESVGGKGGNGQGTTGGDKGLDGLPADSVFGLGGKPVDATGCMNGGNGNTGGPGTAGVGAQKSDIGTLDLGNGYEGKAGTNGSQGKVGQGGGGGGGGKGTSACYGAGGGGGGAGGCGGRGGTGGQPGGASIGLISLGAKLTFDTVTITASNGGNGGSGGQGQDGAIGGNGGKGGMASMGATAACGGGTGGFGGKGGMGGGGRGGHSIGIAFMGDPMQLMTTGAAIKIGIAGDGGVGKGPSGAGIKGEAAETFPFGGE